MVFERDGLIFDLHANGGFLLGEFFGLPLVLDMQRVLVIIVISALNDFLEHRIGIG